MFTIRATQNTFLKRQPIASSELPSAYKKYSPKGTEWSVDSSSPDVDDHIKIELAYGAGTWYAYSFHWDGFPQTVAPQPKSLRTIKAAQDTYLKREIRPASELSNAYKKLSKQGTEWKIESYSLETDDHIKIELAYGAGTWYVYAFHWEGFPNIQPLSPPAKPTMITIRATQDTYLKREIKPASELPDAYKKLNKKGTEWQVENFTEEAGDHMKIDLAYGSGTWYLYKLHWEGFPGSASAAAASSGSTSGGGSIDGVPVSAIDLIKKFEGIELHAYPDPLTGGDPWTIGYGSTFYENGAKVKKGDTITKEQAERELINNCKKSFLPHLAKIPHFNEMDDNQKGAILSFAYNLGARFYGANNFETITRTLKNKDWGNMRKALILYRNPGSNVEAGLLRRRNAEADVWFTNVKENK
ncbi:glycoside hydrolase family 24 [[Leptolyngbya] sp. PCC 7376]|uniref:lysozyme n=1 Tax=[Leptolyngbya] sp. PCC 7376 TaxID=111781 RepID=UPI00029EE6BF|nr:lysozyme [[Leptolyngbya] sp. PCC 7376]AFY38897.1 glycoside hydrolase family 24 [[Leptolyngbya] sp. PCC 7376]